MGGGCELAMACHFRLCSDSAQFGQPEISLGLIPGYGGTQRLTRYIGKGRALEALLTGNTISAQQALQWGLVNYVTSQDELLDKTKSILKQIISKAPLAIAKCITAANAAFGNRGWICARNHTLRTMFQYGRYERGYRCVSGKKETGLQGNLKERNIEHAIA